MCILISAFVLGAAPAFAQPEVKADERVNDEARKRFYEGIRHLKAERYRDARAAFLQAYALRPDSVEILQNLGMVEIDAGYPAAGARHLSLLLRQSWDRLPAADLQHVKERFAYAETKVGRLSITVAQAGADIEVDGEFVSKSPLGYEYHVEPGEHRISIRRGDLAQTHVVTATAGELVNVALDLTAPIPAGTSHPAATKTPGEEPPPAKTPPEAKTQAPLPGPPPVVEVSRRVWWPVVVGAGSTAVAVGVAVVAGVLHTDADREVDRLRTSIGPFGCAEPSPACAELGQALERRTAMSTLFTVSAISTGLLAAGTGAAWLWWPRQRTRVAVSALLSPGSAGALIQGSF